MSPTRTLLKSLAVFGIAYVAGMLMWFALDGAYGAYYRFGGNTLFGSWGRYARADFRSHHEIVGDGIHDCAVFLKPDACPAPRRITLSTKYMGYAPTVLVVALTLALPFSRRRRLRAMFWGLIGVSLFISLRTAVMLADQFSGTGEQCTLYVLSPTQKRLLSSVAKGLAQSPPVSYMIPVVIWVLASFRRGDWSVLATLIGSGSGHERERPPDRNGPR